MNVLAIDLGLSAVKAGVFGAGGALLALAEKPNSAVSRDVDIAPVNMDGLWRLACETIRASLAKAEHAHPIEAVVVCGHGNGVYLVDRAGRGICGVSSMDTRAESVLAGWQGDGRARKIAEIVGGHLWAGQPLAILAAMKERLPSGLTLLFAKDWIRCRLTGRRVTDPGDASAAGLLALADGRWAREAMNLAGVEGLVSLPDLAESSQAVTGSITASAASITGLAEGTLVVAGSIDLAMGALGDGLSDDRSLHVTAGTWAIHQMRRKEISRPNAILQTIRSPWLGETLWVESSPTSGINLTWLRQRLTTNGHSFTQWDAWAGAEVREDDPIYLPYPAGCWDMPLQRAGFVGLPLRAGPKRVVRAVYEGIVLGHCRQIQKYLSLAGGIDRLIVTGGLTRSVAWRQMLSDATQLPLEAANDPHAALRGAAACAAEGIGMHWSPVAPSREQVVPRREMKTHWQTRYDAFLDILKSRSVERE